VREKNFYLTKVFQEKPLDEKAIYEEYMPYADRIGPYAADVSVIMDREIRMGRKILFEGAQGCHLDIDHGTFPYVTASNTVAGNACSGTGVGPSAIDVVVGICKAYTTRVGEGPFVTELDDAYGEHLQKTGMEFGATTGRKRRCGWLDLVLIKQSVRVSGITGLAITKLDVLTGIDTIKICVGYRTPSGDLTESVPPNLKVLAKSEPIYEELEGWTEDISGARRLEELPHNARRYLERIEALSGVKLLMISVGPGREETIVLKNPFRD
jgi:adenylosuccinate synthase